MLNLRGGFRVLKPKSRDLLPRNWVQTYNTLIERPTFASPVPLFLLGHFPANECEISDFCLLLENGLI